MSGGLAGFSRGRIQFIPNNQQRGGRDYSDRSVIELRELDFPNCTLRGIDIAKNNEKIFDIPLKKEKQYKYGESKNNPDEIRSNDGTYHLWLDEKSRDGFYKELRKYFQQLRVMSGEDDTSDQSHEDNDSHQSNRNSDDNDDDIPTGPGKPDSSVVSPKDLLLDVHRLSNYIEQGAAQAAGQIASQLASKGVRLRATSSFKNVENEKEFTISVQLDGNEYGIDQHGATIPVDVFQSTTVRELRAVFELAYQYRPSSQYFFVNGCLAHDNLSMKDLKVGPNSLFVLFLLTHLKSFQNTGPWRCSACRTNNQPNNLRCTTCKATRNE